MNLLTGGQHSPLSAPSYEMVAFCVKLSEDGVLPEHLRRIRPPMGQPVLTTYPRTVAWAPAREN